MMRRRRPCRICRKWFQVHPRVGSRQRVCSSAACQRERHRRACVAWHRRNPGYDREGRLQRKLRPAPPPKPCLGPPLASPIGQLDWDEARDVVGLEVAVVIEASAKVLYRWARDAVIAQLPVREALTPQHPPQPARDEIAREPRPP